jgi:hypothetical protein
VLPRHGGHHHRPGIVLGDLTRSGQDPAGRFPQHQRGAGHPAHLGQHRIQVAPLQRQLGEALERLHAGVALGGEHRLGDRDEGYVVGGGDGREAEPVGGGHRLGRHLVEPEAQSQADAGQTVPGQPLDEAGRVALQRLPCGQQQLAAA